MLLLSLLLTTLFPQQLKGSKDKVVSSEVEDGFFPPSKVYVEIANFISLKNLTVHCKDKHNDLGIHKLEYGEIFEFSFRPNFFWKVSLYFCQFTWEGGSHYFDIYKQSRDRCIVCVWNIFENGPCKVYRKYSDCYVWNKNVLLEEGGRL